MGGVMQKGPLCPEPLSYQKKDGRSWPRPSFFWYDTDFLDFFFDNSVSYQKKAHSSFFWYDND